MNAVNIFLNSYRHTCSDIVDCQIMHMKDICNSCDLELSASMCFGLSESFNFTYWLDRSSKIPCLIMLGRNIDTLELFFNKFNLNFEQIEELEEVIAPATGCGCATGGICL